MVLPVNTDNYEITADPGLDSQDFRREFCEMIGIPATIPPDVVIKQIIGNSIPDIPENAEPINFQLASIASERPRSIQQAQFLMQLQMCHDQFTRMIRKSASENWPENIERYLNSAAKLSRIFVNGLKTYNNLNANNITKE